MRVETLIICNFSSDVNERIINKQKTAKPIAGQGHDWHPKGIRRPPCWEIKPEC